MANQAILHLHGGMFGERERKLADYGELGAWAFRYSTGVAGLRLQNELGELIVLPFQGQQIWDAQFLGRTLTMKSMFSEPNPTQEYLRTYGGFLIHCGATAMGVPGANDTHPLHGELPNAPYQHAGLLLGEDKRGAYLGVSGRYEYTVAFNHHYVARPLLKLYAASSRVTVSMTVENLKRSPMELMYLTHVNFRPVDNGQLIYSAPCTPEHVRVRSSIPSHIHPQPGYAEFLAELELHPARHNILEPGLAFDPEVVFYIDYRRDAAGWAHSMQVHPDGSADFISHQPEQLSHGIRWISRTPDQDALGLLLPATAEPEGYTAEKAKGNIITLAGGKRFHCDLELGALTPAQTQEMAAHIDAILAA